MKTVTIENLKTALRNAAAQHGASGVAHTKALMLSDCMVVDESGAPIDPAAIDVMISPAVEAAETDMAKPDDAKAAADAADAVAKAVRSEIRAAIADSVPVRKGIVTDGSDDPVPFVSSLKHFKDARKAYRFGRFITAASGNAKSAAYCASNGIVLKAHSEGNNSAGGFLVPDEFSADLITLREQYGVFRKYAKVYPMSRDTLFIPRRLGTLTSYWTGETKAATESTQTFDNVQLVAKKLFALTTTSTELAEDAIVNIGDSIAGEIAYEFAKREDEAGFNGDGTSSFGGIVGLKNAIGSAGSVDSGANTNALSSTTITSWRAAISTTMGTLPAYAFTPNTRFFCNKAVYHAIFEQAAANAGGVTGLETTNGVAPRYFGYDVVFVQAMSGAIGSGTDGEVLAYFGDLSMSSAFGDRRAITVKTSDSALNAFEQDEIVIKGTQRVDIVNHSCGDSSSAGAIVMLTR